jgi:hypothetical protein
VFPLPVGERVRVRVRGLITVDKLGPPHPDPLPDGERETARIGRAKIYNQQFMANEASKRWTSISKTRPHW